MGLTHTYVPGTVYRDDDDFTHKTQTSDESARAQTHTHAVSQYFGGRQCCTGSTTARNENEVTNERSLEECKKNVLFFFLVDDGL